MNARQRQYLFGVIFLAFGIYQLVLKDMLEASLYMVAGAAFIFNTAASEPSLVQLQKSDGRHNLGSNNYGRHFIPLFASI